MNNEPRTGVLKWREPVNDEWYVSSRVYIIPADDWRELGGGWRVSLPVTYELHVHFGMLTPEVPKRPDHIG